MVVRLVLLGTIAVSVLASRADAQPPPADRAKIDTARQYVNAGLAAQDTGDYDTAITLFKKAYLLVPHPVLLFNLAQANRLAGRTEEALVLYGKYLAADPGGPQAPDARALIAEIEARKAEARRADEARKADEARRAEQARLAEEARKAEDRRKLTAARDAEARPSEPSSPVETAAPGPSPQVDASARNLRITGIGAIGVGVVALAIGTGYGVHAHSLSNQLSRPGATYDPAKVRAGERANTIEVTGLVGGAALVAAGAALCWWGYRDSAGPDRITLAPIVTDRLAGLVISGSL